jgi:glutathione S-transferase
MLELYHTGISTCSQKVRLVLAEKGLDFVSHDVNLIGGGQHDPEYVKLNPNHVVPTLVDDGHALIESTLINEYLDEAYPDTPMKPADAVGRHALRLWTKKIDALHPNAGVITFAIGPRTLIQSQPKEVREAHIAAIPDPAQRERRRSVIEHGVKAPEFAGAIARFVETLEEIEATMSQQPWLSGSDFGLADAATLPYVLRLDHLGMATLIEARPKLAAWLSRVQARPAYAVAVDAWLAEPVVTMFRNNGAAVWEEVKAVLEAS